jgi:hypothetical protein
MSETHPSDSLIQRSAEPLILAGLSSLLGTVLTPSRVNMGDGVFVEIDGASEDRSILVEAYAHVGPLKGAQPRKLAADAFKLTWAGKRLGSKRLVLAIADGEVAAHLARPKAWLTAALRDSGVEVIRVELDSLVMSTLSAAQRTQYR